MVPQVRRGSTVSSASVRGEEVKLHIDRLASNKQITVAWTFCGMHFSRSSVIKCVPIEEATCRSCLRNYEAQQRYLEATS